MNHACKKVKSLWQDGILSKFCWQMDINCWVLLANSSSLAKTNRIFCSCKRPRRSNLALEIILKHILKNESNNAILNAH